MKFFFFLNNKQLIFQGVLSKSTDVPPIPLTEPESEYCLKKKRIQLTRNKKNSQMNQY